VINIVLVEPEIPPNTGNIARLCAGTNSLLHLVKPLGFEITDKEVKRAGLDYWDKVKIIYWNTLSEFLSKNPLNKMYFLSTKAKKNYTEVKYQDGDFLVFGKETKGLPEELIFGNLDRAITIPIDKHNIRSLNLSTSAGIVLYEALRQLNFSF
jgi:tRNA (cytidine/uridine-2'-O-)-methyltransferase